MQEFNLTIKISNEKIMSVNDFSSQILEKIDFKEVLKSQKMARIKKKRNVSFCLLLKRIGKKTPDFGSDYDANMGLKTILNYFQIRFQQFVGKNKFLWNVIPLLKARVNIH